MMKQTNKQTKRERGQSLVEMALMMTVFILLLAGVLDLGRMFFTYLALQSAAGEGSTYGSIFPYRHYSNDDCVYTDSNDQEIFCSNDSTSTNYAADPDNIHYRVQNESPSGLIDWSTTQVFIDAPYPIAGNYITVSVTYEYDILTPVIEIITGDTLTLRATEVSTIVGQ